MNVSHRFGSFLLPLLALAAPAAAGDPTGLWWAERGAAQVEIRHCDGSLCGRVVWLRSPLDEHGCALRDVNNPDHALREREVVGIELLSGLRPSPHRPNEWSEGSVYDPGSGRKYRAILTVEGPDRLLLRGYFGIRLLGRTTRWIRVGGEDQCRDFAGESAT